MLNSGLKDEGMGSLVQEASLSSQVYHVLVEDTQRFYLTVLTATRLRSKQDSNTTLILEMVYILFQKVEHLACPLCAFKFS